ncbi:hypothetical protein K502DRAFT_349991 [Neoconidiobolus thromboides FSU 785]|nr:hypothetical protein K502DRAFT_349991 [Neoconidiobolus thromboides FSU 785]
MQLLIPICLLLSTITAVPYGLAINSLADSILQGNNEAQNARVVKAQAIDNSPAPRVCNGGDRAFGFSSIIYHNISIR